MSASQKALALPPGLAFAAVSQRFVERARSVKDRGVYLDVLRYEESAAKSQSPTTPAVSLLFALDRQLADIELETLEARFARHAAMSATCAAWMARAEAASLGVSLVARAAEHRSPSHRMPDIFSLTRLCGIRSSAASGSVVNRGQFCE